MKIAEIKQRLLEAAAGDAALESRIIAILDSGASDIEAQLLALAGANPILAAAINLVLPHVKTYVSDLIKSRGPIKVETDGDIKIVFED